MDSPSLDDPAVAVLRSIVDAHAACVSSVPTVSPAAEASSSSGWWHFNDEYVRPIALADLSSTKTASWFGQAENPAAGQKLTNANAYMLFYDRVLVRNGPPVALASQATGSLVDPARVPPIRPGTLLVPLRLRDEIEGCRRTLVAVSSVSAASPVDFAAVQQMLVALMRRFCKSPSMQLDYDGRLAVPRVFRRVDALEVCGRIVLSSWVVRGSAVKLSGIAATGNDALVSPDGLLGQIIHALAGERAAGTPPEGDAFSAPLEDGDALDLCERLVRIITYPGADDGWLVGATGRDSRGNPPALTPAAISIASPLLFAAFRRRSGASSAVGAACEALPASVMSALCCSILSRLGKLVRPLAGVLESAVTARSDSFAPGVSTVSPLTDSKCETSSSCSGPAPFAPELEVSLESGWWKQIESFCGLPEPVLALRAVAALGTSPSDPFELHAAAHPVAVLPLDPCDSVDSSQHDLTSARKAARALDFFLRSYIPIIAVLNAMPIDTDYYGVPSSSSPRSTLLKVSGVYAISTVVSIPRIFTSAWPSQIFCGNLSKWCSEGPIVSALLLRNHALEWLLQVCNVLCLSAKHCTSFSHSVVPRLPAHASSRPSPRSVRSVTRSDESSR